jgi:pyridoxamine 5'-phosphate oxidase
MSEARPPDTRPRDEWLSGVPPSDPLPRLRAWLAEARADSGLANPDAMVLATAGVDGRPSARVVLCRAADWQHGWLGFYTNQHSAKGRALAERPLAALTFHWDSLGRQARIEGPVRVSPASDADAYFGTRPRGSQLAAWASAQSEPAASRDALDARFDAAVQRFGAADDASAPPVPRPPHWGGYRVWIERVELWAVRPSRLHDRIAWQRALTPDRDGFRTGPWRARRLMP